MKRVTGLIFAVYVGVAPVGAAARSTYVSHPDGGARGAPCREAPTTSTLAATDAPKSTKPPEVCRRTGSRTSKTGAAGRRKARARAMPSSSQARQLAIIRADSHATIARAAGDSKLGAAAARRLPGAPHP